MQRRLSWCRSAFGPDKEKGWIMWEARKKLIIICNLSIWTSSPSRNSVLLSTLRFTTNYHCNLYNWIFPYLRTTLIGFHLVHIRTLAHYYFSDFQYKEPNSPIIFLLECCLSFSRLRNNFSLPCPNNFILRGFMLHSQPNSHLHNDDVHDHYVSSFNRMLNMKPTPPIFKFGKILGSLVKLNHFHTVISRFLD